MALTVEELDELCRQFVQEGMRFDVRSVDGEAGQIELDLVFEDVECIDCVLPGEHLERLIASRVAARTGTTPTVVLHDPRRAGRPAAAANLGRLVEVVDPTATGRGGDPDPGPDAGALAGKRVLFRVDAFWRSWDVTVEEWTALLEERGATVRTWKRWQGLPGDEGRRHQADYEGELADADVVISGLANCGSCSAWTIRDAITGLGMGRPTMAVATEHFVPLARLLAEDGRRPGLRLLELPYPLETRSDDEVRDIARDAFPAVLTTLGVEA